MYRAAALAHWAATTRDPSAHCAQEASARRPAAAPPPPQLYSKGNQVGAFADKNDVALAAAMRGGDGEAVAAASPALRAGSSAACNKVAPLKDPAYLRGLPI